MGRKSIRDFLKKREKEKEGQNGREKGQREEKRKGIKRKRKGNKVGRLYFFPIS